MNEGILHWKEQSNLLKIQAINCKNKPASGESAQLDAEGNIFFYKIAATIILWEYYSTEITQIFIDSFVRIGDTEWNPPSFNVSLDQYILDGAH